MHTEVQYEGRFIPIKEEVARRIWHKIDVYGERNENGYVRLITSEKALDHCTEFAIESDYWQDCLPISKQVAKTIWKNHEVFGKDADQPTEALIENEEDFDNFDIYFVEKIK